MATGTQFTGFNLGNTGINNTGFSNTGFNSTGMNNTGINFTGFNFNNQNRNPLAQRYPELTDEEIEELRQAANQAGYTGANEIQGMDIIYNKGINEYEKNKKLDEANTILNQNCSDIAKYTGGNKKIQEQINRLNALGVRIKETNSTAKAGADNCALVNKFVTSNGYQKQYEKYLEGDDELLKLVEQDGAKQKGADQYTYTPQNKGFWQTKAGKLTTLGLIGTAQIGIPTAAITLGVKGTKKLLKGEKAQERIRAKGEKLYNSAVTVTDKDKLNATKYGAEQNVLKEYKSELEQAQKDLELAKQSGQTDLIAAKQKEVDDLTNLISKHETSLDKGFEQTSDIARKKGLVGGSADEIATKAEAEKIKLWDRQIGKALQDATDAGYTTNVNQLVYDITDDIIANPGKYVKNPEDYNTIIEAAQKMKKSWEGVDYTKVDPIRLNSLKSEMAGRNVKLYQSLGQSFDAGKNAETVVREAILKQMREEIYAAGDFASTINGGDGAALKQAFKDRGDFDTIADDMLKQKSLGFDKKSVKSYLERQFKTRVGKKMAEFGKAEETTKGATEAVKGAEAVTEATKGAEIAGEATKGAEVVSEATKGAEVASDVAKGAEVASEVSKGAEVAGKASKGAKGTAKASEILKGTKTASKLSKAGKLAKFTTKVARLAQPVLEVLGAIGEVTMYVDAAKELSQTPAQAQEEYLTSFLDSVAKHGFGREVTDEDLESYAELIAEKINTRTHTFEGNKPNAFNKHGDTSPVEDITVEEMKEMIRYALDEYEEQSGMDKLPRRVRKQMKELQNE